MLSLQVIQTIKNSMALNLKSGVVPLGGLHEYARALGALEAEERLVREEMEKKLVEESSRVMGKPEK